MSAVEHGVVEELCVLVDSIPNAEGKMLYDRKLIS